MRRRYLGLAICERRGCRDQVVGRFLGWDFRLVDAEDGKPMPLRDPRLLEALEEQHEAVQHG